MLLFAKDHTTKLLVFCFSAYSRLWFLNKIIIKLLMFYTVFISFINKKIYHNMINITLAGRDLKYVDLQQLQPERTTTIKAPK